MVMFIFYVKCAFPERLVMLGFFHVRIHQPGVAGVAAKGRTDIHPEPSTIFEKAVLFPCSVVSLSS